jgi:hypothetical protein
MEKQNRITTEVITTLETNDIFVFGSNLAGMHGGGAARTALKWGAIMGQGVGLQGRTYAIPTMFRSADEIKPYVTDFIDFAKSHPEYRFLVTRIGCGIAGFSVQEIAELFKPVVMDTITNIFLPEDFVISILSQVNKGNNKSIY